MEHPHDDFHVRPFPQQPHRGGKELVSALADLEITLTEKLPDREKLKKITERIHDSVKKCNDDKLIDRLRQLLNAVDAYAGSHKQEDLASALTQLLKARVDLKHL